MTDRESIVAYLKREADSIKEDDGPPGCNLAKAATRTAYRSIAAQIKRGDDLKPVKPKATIADLLTLHDLDLGALAHKVGVTGEDITTEHVEMLCDGFTADMGALTVLVRGAIMANDSPLASESARNVAALGAKVRAALATPTIKVATPRILQSADEAPCGCLLQDRDGDITMRLPNGDGRHMGARPGHDDGSGPWDARGIASLVYAPIKVIAEGLTEAECRHLSGLSAADAIAWCKVREADRRG